MDPMFSGDSSALDPMFSGISLHHLLTLNPSLFPDQQPNLHAADTINLLTPKSEYPNFENHQQQQLFTSSYPDYPPEQPFNIFPHFQPPPPPHFHHLPQLHSPETPYRKRFRHQEIETFSPPPPPAPAVILQSHLARQRRQKLSEKTRCLQKLMPWDKKMDQGTLLEEAYKYVKFLQAQTSVLQSMPTTTRFAAASAGGVFGEMERLNRSQALQILVNSPVAQTMLYSKGLCVFSVEQVALLRKFTERKQHQHQHHHFHQNQIQEQEQEQEMSDHDSSKTFLN
ncbi:transcription factor bHLH117 [Lotus japonicus]|uniref:transcription factor bHLH117 n=1 Tax=Lotus japonicus TaxID=34305 RepID=UPI002589980A|nr:transcription factor bHLH117 [Lotus japonicus]